MWPFDLSDRRFKKRQLAENSVLLDSTSCDNNGITNFYSFWFEFPASHSTRIFKKMYILSNASFFAARERPSDRLRSIHIVC